MGEKKFSPINSNISITHCSLHNNYNCFNILFTTCFLQNTKIKKDKFVFFCPQRIGIEKGTDILWKALPLCKSDFEVIQVEWFDDTSDEASIRSHKLLDIKPVNVRLIPKIEK